MEWSYEYITLITGFLASANSVCAPTARQLHHVNGTSQRSTGNVAGGVALKFLIIQRLISCSGGHFVVGYPYMLWVHKNKQ